VDADPSSPDGQGRRVPRRPDNIVAAFVDGVTGMHKQDVLDTCLFAQLVANGKIPNRTADPINWTRAFQQSLERLAWVVPEARFVTLGAASRSFTMDAAVLHILRGLLSGNELEAVQNAIDAMHDLQTQDRRFVIFERESHRSGAGNFQCDEVGEVAGGFVQMKLGAFNFQTSDSVTKVLWWNFDNTNTTVEAMKSTLLLNETVYARVRDAVQNRLVAYVGDYVGGVSFGEMG
jgi:hypothetical protein